MKVIKTANKQATLYEWRDESGNTRRGWLPNSDQPATPEELELAIPYGMNWSDYIVVKPVTPEQVEQELYAHGIWTPEDALKSPAVVQSVIKKLIGLDVRQIFDVANRARKGER